MTTHRPTASMRQVLPVLFGAGALLGLGVPLSKAAAADGVNAFAFALWPTMLAGWVLAALAWQRHGAPVWTARLLRFSVIAGLIGHALPMTAAFWLSSRVGAGYSSVAFTLSPVFTLATALAIGHERFAGARAVAVFIGLAGGLVLVAAPGLLVNAAQAPIGLMLAIPALVGAGNVYRARHMPMEVPREWIAALTLIASSFALLPATTLASGGMPVPATAGIGWLLLQALAMVGGFLGHVELQRRAEPVTFSFLGYVMMGVSVVVGTLMFGERLPLATLPALALIALALELMRRVPPVTASPR